MPADEISVLTEMLLLTNRPNFSPVESWRSEVAMSGNTTDFFSKKVKKVNGVRRWEDSLACGAGDGGCWARAAVAKPKTITEKEMASRRHSLWRSCIRAGYRKVSRWAKI